MRLSNICLARMLYYCRHIARDNASSMENLMITVRPAVYFPYSIACVRLRKVTEIGRLRRHSPLGRRPTYPARVRQRQKTLLTWRQHEWIDVFHVENSSLEFIYVKIRVISLRPSSGCTSTMKDIKDGF
ncbi:jg23782 [Pararge aegeria aegeria]|uniref:Jg23782 protein n=1 Tax=Pararge aegeria aegeria TaxID=348720 RepID=A0A8S4SMD2_9NEOP|nr:jg23782 [Pararge aegeria aegeria]